MSNRTIKKDYKIDDNYSMDSNTNTNNKSKVINKNKKLNKNNISDEEDNEDQYSLSESEQIADIKPKNNKEKVKSDVVVTKNVKKSKVKIESDDGEDDNDDDEQEDDDQTDYTPPQYDPNDPRSNFIAGYLNKKKSSEWASLLGDYNKRFFLFDGKTLKYYETESEAKRDFQLSLKNKKAGIIMPLGGLSLKNIVAIKSIKNEPGLFFDLTTTKSTVRLQAYTEQDRSNWVNTIQRAIDNKPETLKNMVKPSKYYMTGYLQKFKSDEFAMLLGNWNERYFIFDGKFLSYAANAKGGLGYTRIPLRDIESCEPETANDNTFIVVSAKKDYRLRAPSAIDRDNWVKAIGGALHDCILSEAKIKKEIKKSTHDYVKTLLKESNMDETTLGNDTEEEEDLESDDEKTKSAKKNNIHKERAANYVDQLRVEAGISKIQLTKKNDKSEDDSEDSDDDVSEETPKVASKVVKNTKKVVEEESEEETPRISKKKTGGKNTKKVVDSEEEDTPKVLKKKTAVKKAAKNIETSSENESEDEIPATKSVPKIKNNHK